MAGDSEEDEGGHHLAAHVGTDTFPDDMPNEKYRGQKKSALRCKPQRPGGRIGMSVS